MRILKLKWMKLAALQSCRVMVGGFLGVLALGGAQAIAQGQGKLSAAAPVTYDNKFEVYGGVGFMNFQAGQTLPKRMNMGTVDLLGTYWVTDRIGVGADVRGEFGTTPVFPNILNINRPLVYMETGMLGAQVRGPKNQHAALNYHAYAGVSHGVFDGGTQGGVGVATSPSFNARAVGLYSNRVKPMAAIGGSLDFNRTKNLAVRLSPDLILEHFGTETREFFSISAGVIYRFGHR